MNDVFLLKTVDNKWEVVDKYIFDNRKFAVDASGVSRYAGPWLILFRDSSNPRGTMNSEGLTPTDYGIIGRFFKIETPTNSVPGGYVQEPETIQVKRGNGNILYELKTKMKWKRAA